MRGIVVWLVISWLVEKGTCTFFHGPSNTVLKHESTDCMKFGYSLGYEKHQKNLVYGYLNTGIIGDLRECPISYLLMDEGDGCNPIYQIEQTFSRYLNNSRKATEDYKYMLGASIAILNNSFVTCAPMWSGEYTINEKNEFFVWGACFQVENQTVTPLTGLYGHPRKFENTKGSFGWRTLVDDTSNLLLISKPASPALHGDIAFVNIHEEGLGPIKSLVLDDDGIRDERKIAYQNMLRSHRNLGSALASGKFWHMDSVVYAVSFTDRNLDGGVIFLKYTKEKLSIFMKNHDKPFQLTYDDMGITPRNIMFGAAMCGAKLLGGRYTDLVVGAPAQHGSAASDPEFGAVHIYKGSFKKEDFIIRKLTIMGVNEESRFGSSIVANDLDGDGLQELFISAPYQDEGVVYILSGYEISEISREKEETDNLDTVDVSSFKYKQVIKIRGFKQLGFSVVVVSDFDYNGCDEIAISAPDSNKILILKCIPAVTINVTTELQGPKIVPETENEFKINVCINMDYKSNMDKIAGSVSLKNMINGTPKTRANITCDPKTINVNISSKENTYCHIVNIYIVGNEPGLYTFTSEAKLVMNGLEEKMFDPTWVRLSPYSIMNKTQLIERGCAGDECVYHLNIDFLWSGGEIKEGDKYNVNSFKDEVLTLRVMNEGRIAFSACALVHVAGAPVDQLDCSHNSEGYLCRLPAGFKKNTSRDIQIKLKTSRLTNEFTGLNVTVHLYNDCDEKNSSIAKQFYVEYEFTTDKIEVHGVSDTSSITEKTMKTSSDTIDITHVYRISNEGTVLWKNIEMDISIENSHYLKEFIVTSEKIQFKANSSYALDLVPSSNIKVVVTAVVFKKEIEKALLDNTLTITSNLSLMLVPTSVTKMASATSVPVYEKDSTIGQNKILIIIIAVLVAALLFAIVIYILYRVGFFRRKQKEELQAEIRRRSIKRPNNSTSQHEEPLIEINDDEINDYEDALIRETDQNIHTTPASRQSRSTSEDEINDHEDALIRETDQNIHTTPASKQSTSEIVGDTEGANVKEETP